MQVFEDFRQCLGEVGKVLRCASRNPNAAVLGRREWHTHENSPLNQTIHDCPCIFGILAAIDCHKIGSCGQGLQTVIGGNCGYLRAGLTSLVDHLCEILLILKRCQCADLGNPVYAEMVPYLVERQCEVFMGNPITDACARHAVRFREGPEADDVAVGDVDPWCQTVSLRTGRYLRIPKFDIGFIKAKQSRVGNRINQRLNG